MDHTDPGRQSPQSFVYFPASLQGQERFFFSCPPDCQLSLLADEMDSRSHQDCAR
jgi:hypothetical protein